MSDTTTDTPVRRLTDAAAARIADGDGRYLTFNLAGDVYALDILEITEIIEFRSLTVVPMMPSYIRGVINLRGRVLPVIDLASRFGQQPTEVARRTGIIVIETWIEQPTADADRTARTVQGIGIMVDSVNKVIHLNTDDMQPAPEFGAGIRSDFINGMAKYDDDFIIVLNIDRVLNVGDEGARIAALGGTTLDEGEWRGQASAA